jgi:hypothetical protein
MSSLLSTLSSLAMLGGVALAIYFCGVKVLLLVPSAIGSLIIGVIGDILLWEMAHGSVKTVTRSSSDYRGSRVPPTLGIPRSAAPWVCSFCSDL